MVVVDGGIFCVDVMFLGNVVVAHSEDSSVGGVCYKMSSQRLQGYSNYNMTAQC